MKCPFCHKGQAIMTHKDLITKDGVHLGPTYRCNNSDCLFFNEPRQFKDGGRDSGTGKASSGSPPAVADPAAHYPLQKEYDNMEQWLAACDAYRKRKPGAKV